MEGGNISVHEDYFQGYLTIPESIDESDSLSMTANDDLMKNSGIMSGDILLINKNVSIENNSIIAIAKGGNAAVVRKYVIIENTKFLLSDVGVEPIEKDHFILGKVIGFYRVF